MSDVRFVIIDSEDTGQRLDNFLIKSLKGVPKTHVYQIIRKGEVRVNKGRKKANYRLESGDMVRIPPVRVSSKEKVSIPNKFQRIITQNILYEDDALLVLNKPAGIAVHSGSGISVGLIEALKDTHPKYELIHRIDRATSGILLVAKKRSHLKAIQEQIVAGVVDKYYSTIVVGNWAKKTHRVDAPLLTTHNKTLISHQGKDALSIFTPMQNFSYKDTPLSLVKVQILTGRNHQIRVHSTHMNHPILGDDKYGDFAVNKQLGIKRMYLHNTQMSFIHPISAEKLEIICKPDFDILENT